MFAQIILIHPIGVDQIGAQGAALDEAGGGVLLIQQIQHLIDGAVVLHRGGGDFVPLHGRLLAVIGKALGSDQEAIYRDIDVCTCTFGNSDFDVRCTSAFRQLNGGDCFCQVGVFRDLCVGSSIGRNFNGKGRECTVPLGIVTLHNNGIQSGYIAQIEGGTVTTPGTQGTSCQLAGLFGQFIWNFRSCKVILHAGHELAFGGAFGEIQLGGLPGPVVSIGIAVCLGSFQLCNLAVREIKVVQLDQGLDVQSSHLCASEI